MNNFLGIGAFIVAVIIGLGGKIVSVPFLKTRDCIFEDIADIDIVGIITAGRTVVNFVSVKIRFAIGIPGQGHVSAVRKDRYNKKCQYHDRRNKGLR